MTKNYYLKGFVFVLVLCLGQVGMNAQVKKIVSWRGQNTANTIYPYAADQLDAVVTSGELNYSGLTTYDDGRNFWYYGVEGQLASVDINQSPYLSFELETNEEPIDLDRFVLGSASGPLNLQLRWSVDNYASSLGDFSFGDNNTLTSLDLTGKTINSASVTFRLYFYNSSSIYLVLDGQTKTGVEDTPESYRDAFSVSIWSKEGGTTSTLDIGESAKLIKVYGGEGSLSIVNNISTNGVFAFSVFNLSGQLIYSEEVLLNEGLNTVSLNELPGGLYIVSLKGRDVSLSQKVLLK